MGDDTGLRRTFAYLIDSVDTLGLFYRVAGGEDEGSTLRSRERKRMEKKKGRQKKGG